MARGERRIWLRRWTSVPVFEFDALAPAQAIVGPAIVESAMTTVLLRPGNSATVTPHGWLDIAVGRSIHPFSQSPQGEGDQDAELPLLLREGEGCHGTTKLIADGLPTRTSCMVRVSMPLSLSTLNATMLSPSWFAA